MHCSCHQSLAWIPIVVESVCASLWPVATGVRLYRAMASQLQLQQQALHLQHAQLAGLADAVVAAGQHGNAAPQTLP